MAPCQAVRNILPETENIVLRRKFHQMENGIHVIIFVVYIYIYVYIYVDIDNYEHFNASTPHFT